MRSHACTLAGLLTAVMLAATPDAAAQPFERKTPVVLAVEKVGPAVVNILTTRLERRYDFDWWFSRRVPRTYKATSLGSGVIIDPVGLVVTNEHVVRDAAEIKVHLSDGRILEARRIEQAIRSLDLALLQIQAEGRPAFPHVRLGRSDDIMVGETVIALGNPFGLENTVTTGVISAKNRSITSPLGAEVVYNDLLQTDASINPGNSGGALVNINGELIGINTAIHARGEGIGFAIPVDAVRGSIIHLLQLEMQSRGESPGISVAAPPDAQPGLLVTAVAEGGAAAAAGLRAGDRLQAFGGRNLAAPLDYVLALYAASGGDRTPATVRRGEKQIQATIALTAGARARSRRYLASLLQEASTGRMGEYNAFIRQRVGVRASDLTAELRRQLELPDRLRGVLVLALDKGGSAAELGLQRYDVILGFGRTEDPYRPQVPVTSAAELAAALERLSRYPSVDAVIYRRGEDVLHGPLALR
jgi:serine protease Do